ncbi:MAG TPA: metalloregulator ArsR/SmtB family transcription factor [Candidatus Limiplasma sp.]|nr:metalloregulator ArsR/SmtB family transcription factor [Candidatus Limiplasma sp.]HRX09909.1 metalloregulator ArsR/SmtB family transcription factor [Candidatus Limiplasma sp.]
MSDHAAQAKRFKAFCDENRLKIIELLQGGEKCACELIEDLDMGQSTLSYHMKILTESGIVINRQEGKWAHYRISAEGSAEAVAYLQTLTTPKENAGCCTTGCACEENN